MKKSIIYLGIVATMFMNASFASKIEVQQQNQLTDFVKVARTTEPSISAENGLTKPKINLESQSKIKESIAVISSNYKKTIKDVIQEDKKITESQEEIYQPLNLGFTIDEIIKFDNQVIDNTIPNEIYLLNFQMINSNSNSIKTNEFIDLKKETLKS